VSRTFLPSFLHAAAIVVVLAAIAAIAPAPAESNRDFYEHSGRDVQFKAQLLSSASEDSSEILFVVEST